MKVLHVLNHSVPHVDGYAIRSHNILLMQNEQGIEVIAVTSPKHEGSAPALEMIDGLSFYRTTYPEPLRGIRSLPFIKEGLLMRALYSRILEIARACTVDIIHAHSPSLNAIPAYLVARRLGLPTVYEMRTLWEELPEGEKPTFLQSLKFHVSRWIETQIIKRVDAVTVISEGLKHEVLSRNVEENRIHVCPNGIDSKLFFPQESNLKLKSRLQLDGHFLVGFIGSFRYWEGLDLLLRSWERIAKSQPNIHLLLVGEDKGQQLKRLSQSLGIEDSVTFAGSVDRTQVLDYYSIIDLLVYPRPRMKLTDTVTPLKPLEAMAMEKLVLASDVNGHKELIQDGVNGFLFPAGNEGELAKKVLELAERFPQMTSIRKCARKTILENRQWSEIITQYQRVYNSIKERTPTAKT